MSAPSDQKLAEIIPFPTPLRRKLLNVDTRDEALRVAIQMAREIERTAHGDKCQFCLSKVHDTCR